MFLPTVTTDEVIKIVFALKNGAPGYDDIDSKSLKSIVHLIACPLTYVFNLSLSNGVFPMEMKISNVVPLFKGGDEMLFTNYRPVSLLITLSKVLERVMYNRLINFLNEFKLLFEYQFGFRKYFSSYMALMILVDKLSHYLENGDYVIGIFLDFSKAFDTVNHSILLEKMYYYGIRGPALQWFSSYLSGRTQFVSYNGVQSNTKSIKCGVPQGSILGPLLFLLYINDLQNVCQYSLPILFADDTNLFFNSKDITKLNFMLSEELSNISKWLKVNRLSLNINKTKYMLFTKKRYISDQIKIEIDKTPISKTNVSKFLGVIIDDKLTWKDHIAYVNGKIARGVGILNKAKHYLNREALTTLYYSFIYPYITYCNQVWGSNYKSRLNRTVVLQKKALRIVTHSEYRCHTSPLFKQLNLLTVENVNNFLIGIFMHRRFHDTLPSVFNGFFQINSNIHEHQTRTSQQLHTPIIKTDIGKFNIRYRGSKIWNYIISNGINPEVSEASFKIALKKFLVNNN